MKEEGEGRCHAWQRGQGWSAEAISMAQAVPTYSPPSKSFGGGGKGGREGVLGGDLGQSSLPKPLPTWILKGAAVF